MMTFIRSLLYAIWFYTTMVVIRPHLHAGCDLLARRGDERDPVLVRACSASPCG